MISIIVPVYNVKPYVEKCLHAIDSQTFDDFEVIVVDDGSTDGSREIVQNFCKSRPKFHLYLKENGGLMSAWMYAVKRAKGDYLGFVDSDDYPAPNMFATMYKAAKEKNADIVLCDYFAIEGEEEKLVTTSEDVIKSGLYEEASMDEVYKRIFPSLKSGCISNARWNKIFRTSLFMPNTRYCACLSRTFEDRYIVPACVFSAKSFLYIKEPLYYYLHREYSNCGKPNRDLLTDIRRMNECQKKALVDKKMFEDYQNCFENGMIDSVKQYIRRNIWGYGSFELARNSAQELLQANDYCSLILKYKEDILQSGKTGRIVYYAVRFKCPMLLMIGRFFQKRRYQS